MVQVATDVLKESSSLISDSTSSQLSITKSNGPALESPALPKLPQVDGAYDEDDMSSEDEEVSLILRPHQDERMGQTDGHFDRGIHSGMTEALGRGGASGPESDGPWDIPEEDAVSDQTTSPPPLEGEDLSDDEESTGLLPGQSGWLRRRQGWGRLGERGDSFTLNKAIATWNKENLEGSRLGPGTIVRLETTIKDFDSLRLGVHIKRSG
jgi:hypothetical protein